VATNFDLSLTNVTKYLGAVSKLSAGSITTHSLEDAATDQKINGVWVTTMDMDKAMAVINPIFNSNSGGTPAQPVSSVGKKIEVLNGGYTSGTASQTQTTLESKGFTVANIGDYTGAKQAATRIIVSAAGMGADLQALFPGSSVTVDAKQCAADGVDIIVILGTDAS